jgi:hypothetical protein
MLKYEPVPCFENILGTLSSANITLCASGTIQPNSSLATRGENILGFAFGPGLTWVSMVLKNRNGINSMIDFSRGGPMMRSIMDDLEYAWQR